MGGSTGIRDHKNLELADDNIARILHIHRKGLSLMRNQVILSVGFSPAQNLHVVVANLYTPAYHIAGSVVASLPLSPSRPPNRSACKSRQVHETPVYLLACQPSSIPTQLYSEKQCKAERLVKSNRQIMRRLA